MAVTDEMRKDVAAPGMNTLVSGIVGDLRQLLKQHFDMLRAEVREDMRQAKRGAMSVATAMVVAFIGVQLVVAMLVGLLAWLVPDVAWWAWCGIVGGVTILSACLLYYYGQKKLASFSTLPDQTAQAAKENLQWIKNH